MFPISFRQFVFLFFCLELMLLGGGRLGGFSDFPIRIVIFTILLIFVLFEFVRGKLVFADYVKWLMLLALFSLFTSSFVGVLNGNSNENILSDFVQQLYIFSICIVPFFLRSIDDVVFLKKIFSFSAIFLAVCFLLVLSLFYLGFLEFSWLYVLSPEGGDVFFRGESTFFYKSFLYLALGFLFLSCDKKYILALLVFIAVLASLTRGLILPLLVFIVFYFFNFRWGRIALLLMTFVVFSYFLIASTNGLERADSDIVRIQDLKFMANYFSSLDVVFGRGFGSLINDRARIEISWLEIIYKQGFAGLLLWGSIVYYGALFYKRSRMNGYCEIAKPFYWSIVIVMLVSLTNPFMTNSIGAGAIALCLTALHKLSILDLKV